MTWDLDFLLFLPQILVVVVVVARGTELRGSFPREASPRHLPTACSECHATTAHSAQEIKGKAWRPPQLVLHLNSSTLRGPAPCPSRGMTLVTTPLINLINLLHLPFNSAPSHVPARLGLEKVGHRPDLVSNSSVFLTTLLRARGLLFEALSSGWEVSKCG